MIFTDLPNGAAVFLDGNTLVYGSQMIAGDILKGTVAVPSAAKGMVDVLNARSPKNLSDKKL